MRNARVVDRSATASSERFLALATLVRMLAATAHAEGDQAANPAAEEEEQKTHHPGDDASTSGVVSVGCFATVVALDFCRLVGPAAVGVRRLQLFFRFLLLVRIHNDNCRLRLRCHHHWLLHHHRLLHLHAWLLGISRLAHRSLDHLRLSRSDLGITHGLILLHIQIFSKY